MSTRTLRIAAERGEINAEHPLADGPWVFNRDHLRTADAAQFVGRVTQRNSGAAVPCPEQTDLEFSST